LLLRQAPVLDRNHLAVEAVEDLPVEEGLPVEDQEERKQKQALRQAHNEVSKEVP
jgi:hypothetical protein